MDECYRLLRVVIGRKETILNRDDVLRELHYLTTAANEHFKERVIPTNKGTQGLEMASTGISYSYSSLTKTDAATAPVFSTKDRLLIDKHQKEISDLKSKVYTRKQS